MTTVMFEEMVAEKRLNVFLDFFNFPSFPSQGDKGLGLLDGK